MLLPLFTAAGLAAITPGEASAKAKVEGEGNDIQSRKFQADRRKDEMRQKVNALNNISYCPIKVLFYINNKLLPIVSLIVVRRINKIVHSEQRIGNRQWFSNNFLHY